jgi:putative inorganic carbon (HCO3(-)) transporter
MPNWGLAAGFGATAAFIGVLAGYDPTLAIAAALGIAFLLLATVDLASGLVAFTLITFLALTPGVGLAVTITKLAGLALAISWLARIAARERSEDLFWAAHPWMTWVIALFLLWVTLSAIWAEQPADTLTAAYRYVLNAALFLVVFTAIQSRQQVRALIGALILGAAIAGLYGIAVQPSAASAAAGLTSASGLDRLAGTIGDPNQLASVLVVGFTLSIAFAASARRSSAIRLACAAAGTLTLAGIFFTFSRGGLFALGAAMVATVLVARGRRLPAAMLALLVAVTAIGYFSVLAPAGAKDRILRADGGSGRTDIWKVGWRMVEAQPVAGVGAGNFPVSSIHYLLVEPGAIQQDKYVVDQPHVAHNIYLGFLAELGIVGLGLFLAIAGGSLRTAALAARRFARSGDRQMELLTRGVIVAILALLAADFFLSDEYSKQLWLLLALGPALLAVSRRTEERPATR